MSKCLECKHIFLDDESIDGHVFYHYWNCTKRKDIVEKNDFFPKNVNNCKDFNKDFNKDKVYHDIQL